MIEDTIVAIATPIGQAGIGVIRISGPAALDVVGRVFRSSVSVRELPSHTVHLGDAVDPETGEALDHVLLTVFHAPHSYTGENVVELSCHGGPATLRRILTAVLTAGARHAAPGEFTKRAFLNGKLDLAQAEAVNDLIRAQTDHAQRVALRQLEGHLSKRVRSAGGELAEVLTKIEASIDFPDDVDEPGFDALRGSLERLTRELEALLSSADRGRVYREGLRVTISGRPNVGKSSLLNALLRQSRAIVTPMPGTTRDTIEEPINIKGVPILAIDTAGLRDTGDAVETLGVERAEASIERAQIVLLVVDAHEGIAEEDRRLYAGLRGKPALVVLNKTDLLRPEQLEAAVREAERRFGPEVAVPVSALNGTGIEKLEDRIAELAVGGEVGPPEDILVSNVRHKRAIESALVSLRRAAETVSARQPVDLVSVDLVASRNALGEITGETAAEDLIDRIFSEFCVGK